MPNDNKRSVSKEKMQLFAGELLNAGKKVVVNFGTVSSLPVTKSKTEISEDMIVVGFEIDDEEAFSSDPTITLSSGSAVLSGTLESGKSTSVIVYLERVIAAN